MYLLYLKLFFYFISLFLCRLIRRKILNQYFLIIGRSRLAKLNLVLRIHLHWNQPPS